MAIIGTDNEVAAVAVRASELALARPVQPKPKRRNFNDITGRTFADVIAIEYVGTNGRIALWRCQCACGNYLLRTSNALLSNIGASCAACARKKMRRGKAKYDETLLAARLPNLTAGASEKACQRCRKVLPVAAFSKRSGEPDGLQRMCRGCCAGDREVFFQRRADHVRSSNKEASRRYYEKYPDRRASAYLKTKYGITLDEYNQMLESQGGVCAICGIPASPNGIRLVLAVDHDHQTGRIRGLLCHSCNFGIGAFIDNPDFLRKAADYLDRSVGIERGGEFTVENHRVLNGRVL